MIQLVVNTYMLREIDENKLISAYGHLYFDEQDVTDDNKIKENLIKLFDWDINGNNGLGVYCGKFESIKRKDWEFLINFIKNNSYKIKVTGNRTLENRKLEGIKVILNNIEEKEEKSKEYYSKEDYAPKNRGHKAKPCVYKGKYYKSRKQCRYIEGLSEHELFKYLVLTGQMDEDSKLAQKYLKLYEGNSNI